MTKRMLVIALAAMTVLVGVMAQSASAQIKKGYEEFSGCPNQANVDLCLRSATHSGSIQIGATNTPINKEIVFSGGITNTGGFVFNGSGGLNAPPLNVPGGLSGLTGLSEFLINLLTLGAHQVQAQAVLVGTPVVPLTDEVNVKLPVKIQLINPFLKSTCAIGSAANPVVLNMTTGTTSPPLPNKPITGNLGDPVDDPKGLEILFFPNITLVDNAFSAPAATGCDLIGFGLINSLVNTRVGLPSPAGKNTAIQSATTLRIAQRINVYQ